MQTKTDTPPFVHDEQVSEREYSAEQHACNADLKYTVAGRQRGETELSHSIKANRDHTLT